MNNSLPPDYTPFKAKDIAGIDDPPPPCNPDTIVHVWLSDGQEAPGSPRKASSFFWGQDVNPPSFSEVVGFKFKK